MVSQKDSIQLNLDDSLSILFYFQPSSNNQVAADTTRMTLVKVTSIQHQYVQRQYLPAYFVVMALIRVIYVCLQAVVTVSNVNFPFLVFYELI